MLTETEKKILEALDQPLTKKQWSEKIGYKKDSINPTIRKLNDLGCITSPGFAGKERLYESTGKIPEGPKTLGFTVFGVRI